MLVITNSLFSSRAVAQISRLRQLVQLPIPPDSTLGTIYLAVNRVGSVRDSNMKWQWPTTPKSEPHLSRGEQARLTFYGIDRSGIDKSQQLRFVMTGEHGQKVYQLDLEQVTINSAWLRKSDFDTVRAALIGHDIYFTSATQSYLTFGIPNDSIYYPRVWIIPTTPLRVLDVELGGKYPDYYGQNRNPIRLVLRLPDGRVGYTDVRYRGVQYPKPIPEYKKYIAAKGPMASSMEYDTYVTKIFDDTARPFHRRAKRISSVVTKLPYPWVSKDAGWRSMWRRSHEPDWSFEYRTLLPHGSFMGFTFDSSECVLMNDSISTLRLMRYGYTTDQSFFDKLVTSLTRKFGLPDYIDYNPKRAPAEMLTHILRNRYPGVPPQDASTLFTTIAWALPTPSGYVFILKLQNEWDFLADRYVPTMVLE